MLDTETQMKLEKELIERVENAAREGAREGAGKRRGGGAGGIITGLLVNILTPVIVVMLALAAIQMINPFSRLGALVEREASVEERDLTLKNNGIFGYTAADFSEAVLGKAEQLAKLEVYSREISGIATLTNAGVGNLKVFSKNQLITYHGTAIYVVDLRKMKESDIELDEETMTVTLHIPHAQMNPINIPSEEIEFGDVNRGVLSFGDMKVTPEAMAKVETEAKNKMLEKLEDSNAIEEADRFARLTVLELYQPVIKNVANTYSVEIEFAE